MCCSPWGHKDLDTTEGLDNKFMGLNCPQPEGCVSPKERGMGWEGKAWFHRGRVWSLEPGCPHSRTDDHCSCGVTRTHFHIHRVSVMPRPLSSFHRHGPGMKCFTGGSDSKEFTCNMGYLGLIPGLGRSWEEAWQPTSVFLPGESPWTEEPGRLQFTGSQRVGQD